MPVVMTGDRVPPRWAEKKGASLCGGSFSGDASDGLHIALVNNMPDPALEDTEVQFFDLLDAAAGDLPVFVTMFSLAEVIRGERARAHIAGHYSPVAKLLKASFDGAIITGTEPKHRNMRDEPYWRSLTQVFDWAETGTTSTILSCLAAHASVLHSDNIERNPLGDKQFGVFEYKKNSEHPLIAGAIAPSRFPHSRWNEVRDYALVSRGYEILDKSPDAGVNLFVKRKQRSLFVHFQGHPEYFTRTLLKEYRRDVRRYLTHERETYPNEPRGYFDVEATRILNEFRKNAEANRQDDLMDVFPEAAVGETLQNTWHDSAVNIYRNWLDILSLGKTGRIANPSTVATSANSAGPAPLAL
jgi:homoserine O-succinyltransferase/O-acetyltransferase